MVCLEFYVVLNVKPAADIKQKLSLWLGGNDLAVSIFLQPLSEAPEDADDGRYTLGNHIQVLVTFSSHGSFYSWVENYFNLLNLLSLTCCIFAHSIISLCVFIYFFPLHWKKYFPFMDNENKTRNRKLPGPCLRLGQEKPLYHANSQPLLSSRLGSSLKAAFWYRVSQKHLGWPFEHH